MGREYAPLEVPAATEIRAKRHSLFRSFYVTNERLILGALAVTSFFLGWEIMGRSGYINPLFLSSPSKIIDTGWDLYVSGEIVSDFKISGKEFVLGYALSIVVGVPLGILVGWYKRLNYVFDPFLSALYATPRITLLPLIIMWFGIGLSSKIVIIFLGAVFPIIISSLTGVKTVDTRLLNVARCFGAKEQDIFKKVIIQSCVPFIITGLRLGLAQAIIGVIVAEFFSARGGIGFMITTAGAMFETNTVFVGIMITAFCGITFTEILRRIEKRFEKWRPKVGAA